MADVFLCFFDRKGVVDHEAVERAVLAMAAADPDLRLLFDRWYATTLIQRLEGKGVNCQPITPKLVGGAGLYRCA